MQAGEVEIPAVHDVDRAGLDDQIVEEGHIRAFSLGNVHNRGNHAAQIQLRVQLHGGVTTTIARPREDGQTEIDDRGIERVDRVRQVDRQRLVDIEGARRPNETLREVGVDTPIAGLVGIRQRRSRDAGADARVIEPGLHRTQARFDITQTLAVGELREGHAQILIPAREPRRLVVAAVSRDARLEFARRHMGHQLSEDGAARWHPPFCCGGSGRRFCRKTRVAKRYRCGANSPGSRVGSTLYSDSPLQ